MARNREQRPHQDSPRPAPRAEMDQRTLFAIRAGLGHSTRRAPPVSLARVKSLDKKPDRQTDG
jgi:hypothetical protein